MIWRKIKMASTEYDVEIIVHSIENKIDLYKLLAYISPCLLVPLFQIISQSMAEMPII